MIGAVFQANNLARYIKAVWSVLAERDKLIIFFNYVKPVYSDGL